MKCLFYAMAAFWLVAIFFLGWKTSHNPIAFRILLAMFNLAFLSSLGLIARSRLETVLGYARKMWFGLILIGVVMAVTPHTRADEILTFNPEIPAGFSIELPKPQSEHFVWKGQPEYKQERLAYYQDQLRERGITDPEAIKLFVAQVVQENGALAEDVMGDHNCSVGIPQRNVCNYGYTATSFVKKYPEWQDWRFQIRWLADSAKAQYDKYNGDMFRAIVAHNCPACAAANRNTNADYFGDVSKHLRELAVL